MKKVASLVTIAALVWMFLPGCAPQQRPADDMGTTDRTNYPNDMYAPDNGGFERTGNRWNRTGNRWNRTGNRWNDWMGRDRVRPMDVDNNGFMDNNIGPDNDGILGDTMNRRPPGNTRTR